MNINPQTGLYGEYGFIYEPFWYKLSFIIPAIFIVVCVLMFLSYFLYIYYQKRKIARMTPAERAVYEIKQLDKKQEKNIKIFTENILIILKMYGEKKYKEKIHHYTPQECIVFFSSKIDNEQEKNQIKQLFLDIESILFSRDYKNKEDFFTEIPEDVYSLIKSVESNYNKSKIKK